MLASSETPEAVAYQLMMRIAAREKPETREEVLSLYEDCLKAAKGHSRK